MFASIVSDALAATAAVAATARPASPMPGEMTPDTHSLVAVDASGNRVHVCTLPALAFPSPELWAHMGAILADAGFPHMVEAFTVGGMTIETVIETETGAIVG